MTKKEIEEKLKVKEERLECYLVREKEMLTGGVQSYGVGTRNLARYNTDLSTVRNVIKQLEDEIAELKALQNGGRVRKAVGIVPRDW